MSKTSPPLPDVVVTDATALMHLPRVGLLWILPRLFKRIVMPPAVEREVREGLADGLPGPDFSTDGAWLEPGPTTIIPLPSLAKYDSRLGDGEKEAISLAQHLGIGAVLVDDGKAREATEDSGQRAIGTLVLLVHAKNAGLIPLVRPIIETLIAKGFRGSLALQDEILDMAGEL